MHLMLVLSFPQKEALLMIYSQILKQHVTDPQQKFHPAVEKFTDPLIDAALYLHDKIAATFLPTVIKFHYLFNLRDLTNIFQVRVAKYMYTYINRQRNFPRDNNGDITRRGCFSPVAMFYHFRVT